MRDGHCRAAGHYPDGLTALSVNNLFSRVRSLSATGTRSVPVFGPECRLLEAQSSQAAFPDHPLLQRCADRARLTLRVRVALGAAQILSPAQGETGLMLTNGRMRLAGMF